MGGVNKLGNPNKITIGTLRRMLAQYDDRATVVWASKTGGEFWCEDIVIRPIPDGQEVEIGIFGVQNFMENAYLLNSAELDKGHKGKRW